MLRWGESQGRMMTPPTPLEILAKLKAQPLECLLPEALLTSQPPVLPFSSVLLRWRQFCVPKDFWPRLDSFDCPSGRLLLVSGV